jgi:hypothetical protein
VNGHMLRAAHDLDEDGVMADEKPLLPLATVQGLVAFQGLEGNGEAEAVACGPQWSQWCPIGSVGNLVRRLVIYRETAGPLCTGGVGPEARVA